VNAQAAETVDQHGRDGTIGVDRRGGVSVRADRDVEERFVEAAELLPDTPVVPLDPEGQGDEARRHDDRQPPALRELLEDADDQNQPLMVWYAAEPLADVDMARALTLTAGTKLPRLFSFMTQRVGAAGTPQALKVLAELLARTDNVAQQRDLVDAINAAAKK